MAYDEFKDFEEQGAEAEDKFLADDTYEEYDGPDLSGDPMLEQEARKSWFSRRRERKEQQKKEELERQRAALKAEILAEIRAEKELEKLTAMEQEALAQAETEPDTYAADTEEGAPPRRRSKFSSYLMSILSGNILSRAEVRKVYPYLLFIVFLMFIYIGNVFRMQSLHRQHERLTTQVKELRAKSLTIASQKMKATRQSSIIEEIERRGLPLHESLSPNKVISKK